MDFSDLAFAFDAFVLHYQVPALLPALMRVAVAGYWTAYVVVNRHDLWAFMRPNGVVSPEAFAALTAGSPQPTVTDLLPRSEAWARAVFVGNVVFGVSATLGIGTRASMWLLFVCMVSLQSRTCVLLSSGGEAVLRTVLFFLACSDTSAALAFDALGRDDAPAAVSGWALRNIQILVCGAYFWSSLYKLYCRHWLDGSTVANVLRSPMWSRDPATPLLAYPALLRAVTIGTVVFEFTAPVGLFTRPVDVVFLILAFGLHTGIVVTMQIGTFGPAMMIALLSFGAPLVTRLEALLRP
jgi:hypothetical protein